MASTVDSKVQIMLGTLMLQNAQLQTQLEQTLERVGVLEQEAAPKAEKPPKKVKEPK